jgi:Mn2+/Fe2+ NRAMP family transporter
MSFDISRLRRADQIVGGGAIAFFIFLFFFNWYGVSSNIGTISGVNVNVSKSGWDTFTNSRWIWIITIVVALGSVVLVAGQRKLELPLEPGVIVAGLGALSTALIVYRIVHHPTASASFGGFHASVGIKIGIWLGLLAALATTYGGYLQMQAEGTSLADVREQASDAFSGITTAAAGGSAPQSSAAERAAAAPPIPPPAAPPSSGPSGQPPPALPSA